MIAADLTQIGDEIPSLDKNQIQLALAVANVGMLQSLLVSCTPAIAQPHQIGQLRVSIGTPAGTEGLDNIDAVVEYEHLWCVLSEGAPTGDQPYRQDYQYLTRCQSDLKTLAWRVNLSDAIALLSHGGFQEEHIQRILQLPWDGWHRSWWDTFDAQGQLGMPFQRWFRTRCYSDGTYTLQYRDYYPQDAPPCFRGIWQQVPIMITHSGRQFGEILTGFRKARHVLKAQRCLLLADDLTDLEAEGYMRQGVSLYLLTQSMLADQILCHQCDRKLCPMRNCQDAPVISCRDYTPMPYHD
ncbi:MAG: hypothetical protein F6J95_022520 [Leptolyngbya sp. SIO1E4]|nr:hypothetical protein [Leptolyngbya sp. SIO1E4]